MSDLFILDSVAQNENHLSVSVRAPAHFLEGAIVEHRCACGVLCSNFSMGVCKQQQE